MEIIFKATIFPDCHTETAATPHPRTGTPPGETVKATGTTARATGIPIPLAKKRRGAIYDARTPERHNTTGTTQRNKDTTATPSHHKKRRGAIYDARTPERRKHNKDTTATPSHHKNVGAPFMTPEHPNGANAIKTPPQPPSRRKKRRGAIYDARTPERRKHHQTSSPTIRHRERGRAS